MSSSTLASEFRKEIGSNPPTEIIYAPEEADFDVPAFEKNVFPYSVVLENCYRRVGSTNLYKSTSTDLNRTKKCISPLIP
jgi:hypothetical protein